MSATLMGAVLDRSKSKGPARLMLLAIADRFDDERGYAWPSIRDLAKRCNTSESGVHRSIAELKRLGEISVELEAGIKGVNRYRINLPEPEVAEQGGAGTASQGVPELQVRGCRIRESRVSELAPKLLEPLLNSQKKPLEATDRASRSPMSKAGLIEEGLSPETAKDVFRNMKVRGYKVFMRGQWDRLRDLHIELVRRGDDRSLDDFVADLSTEGYHLPSVAMRYFEQRGFGKPAPVEPVSKQSEAMAALDRMKRCAGGAFDLLENARVEVPPTTVVDQGA